MAEPLRNGVYDRNDENPVTRPDLRAIDGGSEASKPQQDYSNSASGNSSASQSNGQATSGDQNLQSIRNGEEAAKDGGQDSIGDNLESDTVGRGFTPNNTSQPGRLRGTLRNKRNAVIATLLASSVIGIGGSFIGFMNVFKLDHFLSNIESKGFMRYQVDMDGRSSKWIQAYITLRMLEVDSPGTDPGDRDNLFFRSDRVDNNKPLTDWYRTLRTSKFEQDVFEKHGIKFVSIAEKRPDGSTRLRSGMMTVRDRSVEFDLREMEILNSGDWNEINNKMNGRLQATIFGDDQGVGGDREARREIRRVVNAELKPWQVMKRRHIRKDIQNMIGVRDWRFFEKTRDKVAEDTRVMRNKIIVKALPESTKSGKFVQCIFGITECRGSTDPASSENRATNTSSAGASGSESLSDAEGEGPIRKQFFGKVVKNIIPGLNILQTVELINKLDENISSGKVSKFVVAARTAQAIGFYTTYSIARDQIKTGEQTPEEVNQFMSYANGLGNNDVWSSVIANDKTAFGGTVFAAALEENAQNKAEFCSEEYQEKIIQGKVDRNQFAYTCDDKKIGSAERAEKIESWWKNGPLGTVISPILSVYRSATGGVGGWIVDTLGSAISAITDPIVKGALKIAGVDDDVEKAGEWIFSEASEQLGAGPMTDTDTPAGIEGAIVPQGGAALAESSARYQGAAKTNAITRADSINRTMAYNKEKYDTESFSEKYLALSNPESIAASQLYAASTSQALKTPTTFISSVIRSIGSIPGTISSKTTKAATGGEGYTLANFAGIDTYDLPRECIERAVWDMTPQNSTNADELGLISSNELTWDLVSNKEEFYDKLHGASDDEDLILTVYNCGLFDNAVRGATGAKYGYTKDNAINSTASPSLDSETQDTGAVAGDGNMKETIKVTTPGKFITMPSKYSCEGRTTKIDSRIAASLAYMLTKYDMCADDGLANGHRSHGAGLGVDIRPKDQSKQNSKEEWKRTVEAAARDMGWWGDSATDGKSSKGCAPSYSGYGACVGGSKEIPRWVRWLGYNGDVDHGDPWHVFGGSYAHIHIGWASPNGGDAVAGGIISKPIPAVYTFPAPIPDDLKDVLK